MAAVRLMVRENIHRVVVDESGLLVGIVTAMDVMRELTGGAPEGVELEYVPLGHP